MTERRTQPEPESNSPSPSETELTPPWGEEAVFATYPKIQAFVFSRLGEQEGEGVVEVVLEAVLRNIGRVTARTQAGFESWCLGIARNKVNDAWRSQYRDRLQPMAPEDLVNYADSSVEASGVSPGVKNDLSFVLNLLYEAKPPCVEILIEHMLIGVEANIMAANYGIEVDAMRRRIERCFALAQKLAKKHA
jgi:DNA-directed RNA polymerase specialized sigma24 family protein